MDNSTQALRKRLATIWEQPDFATFFNTFATRPARTIKKGSILFNEGDPLNMLYFVKDGFIKLYRVSDEGRDTTIYLFGPGYVLGVRALTSPDEAARHYAEAITDATIITLSREEYFDVVAKHPEYLVDLLHVFIDRLNHAERRLEGFITTDTTARIANFLSDCARRFCKNQKEPILLPIELTHQRIAEFVGSFRETVTISLQKLEEEGIIVLQRGKLTILDLDKLQTYATTHRKHHK